MNYLLWVVLLIYIVYTLTYTIKFNKAAWQFSSRQRLLHIFLFWLIPFIWIIIIKKKTKSAIPLTKPRRHRSDFENNENETAVYWEGGHVHDASDEIGSDFGDD